MLEDMMSAVNEFLFAVEITALEAYDNNLHIIIPLILLLLYVSWLLNLRRKWRNFCETLALFEKEAKDEVSEMQKRKRIYPKLFYLFPLSSKAIIISSGSLDSKRFHEKKSNLGVLFKGKENAVLAITRRWMITKIFFRLSNRRNWKAWFEKSNPIAKRIWRNHGKFAIGNDANGPVYFNTINNVLTFIAGKSGTGKSTMALRICEALRALSSKVEINLFCLNDSPDFSNIKIARYAKSFDEFEKIKAHINSKLAIRKRLMIKNNIDHASKLKGCSPLILIVDEFQEIMRASSMISDPKSRKELKAKQEEFIAWLNSISERGRKYWLMVVVMGLEGRVTEHGINPTAMTTRLSASIGTIEQARSFTGSDNSYYTNMPSEPGLFWYQDAAEPGGRFVKLYKPKKNLQKNWRLSHD